MRVVKAKLSRFLVRSSLGMLALIAYPVAAETQETVRFVASDGVGDYDFGIAVEVLGDTAMVGSLNQNSGGGGGAVYVFEAGPPGQWSQVDRLVTSDAGPYSEFGASLSLQNGRMLVGAPSGTGAGGIGSVFVFDRDGGGQWNQTAKLLASDGASRDQFGFAVSVDGDVAVIGAPYDDDFGSASGSAYVFERDAEGNWNEMLKLKGANTDDRCGSAVAIDGDTIFVRNGGGVAVYTRDAQGNWVNAQTLSPSSGFGRALDISGSFAVVGASSKSFIFERNGAGVWVEAAVLEHDELVTFGEAVAIDDAVAVIGASQDIHQGDQGGNAFVYARDASGNWPEVALLRASDAAQNDKLGLSVAIANNVVLAGAPQNGEASYLYDLSADTDGDGELDYFDSDNDNDGVPDTLDPCPLDGAETVDSDGDGTCDGADPDDDNDGEPDETDAFPYDSFEQSDADGDGVGDRSDRWDNDPERWELRTTVFSDEKPLGLADQGAASTFVADLDLDGFGDVIGVSTLEGSVFWFRNLAGEGGGDFGPKQTISSAADGAYSVHAADLDGDGDFDILSASFSDNKVAWYENRLNQSEADFGPQQVISNEYAGAASVIAADLDNDGDADVVSASYSAGVIVWHENQLDGGAGWSSHVVSSETAGAISVFTLDLDNDGDLEILSASVEDKKIAWYENLLEGTVSGFGAQQVIEVSDSPSPWTRIHAADLDGDGDSEILAANTSAAYWYENRLNQGVPFNSAQLLHEEQNGQVDILALDIDGDADMDVVSLHEFVALKPSLVWYENFSNSSANFTYPREISGDIKGIKSISGSDIDGDGDVDLVVGVESEATGAGEKVIWFENRGAGFDFGDAPINYGTLRRDDGAHHLAQGAMLGSLRDHTSDGNGLPGEGADRDDLTGIDDDDGVVFRFEALSAGSDASVEVTVTFEESSDTNCSAAGLSIWVDFNRDGDWRDSFERVWAGDVAAGLNEINFSVPEEIESGSTYARFRLVCHRTPGSSSGTEYSGEVEDYAVLLARDADGDGTADHLDNCPAVANANQADLDADGQGDVCDDDEDGDGLSDTWELGYGLNPRDPADFDVDTDGDGLGALTEIRLGTRADRADTDGDGVPDSVDAAPLNRYFAEGCPVTYTATETPSFELRGAFDYSYNDQTVGDLDNDLRPEILLRNVVRLSSASYIGAGNSSNQVDIDLEQQDEEYYSYSLTQWRAVDIDGDGQEELAVQWFRYQRNSSFPIYERQVSVYARSSTNGVQDWAVVKHFPRSQSSTNFNNLPPVRKLQFADFDFDGNLELVEVAGSIRIDSPGGTYADEFGSGIDDVLVEDIDLDGDTDIVAVKQQADEPPIWFENRGPDGFVEQELVSNSGLFPIAMADVDGDGKRELVMRNDDGAQFTLAVAKRDEAGDFVVTTISDAVGAMLTPLVVDVDQDGDQDVVAASDDPAAPGLAKQRWGGGVYSADCAAYNRSRFSHLQ